MSALTHTLRAATTAAAIGAVACLGTATAMADPNDTLGNAISTKGYSPSNCSPQKPSEVQSAFPTVVAVMACGQNSDSSGPALAKYFLFANSADLASAFTNLITSDTLVNCGDAKSPTTWHKTGSSDSAGQAACGTDSGKAEVIWTEDAKNVLAFVRASDGDTAALYKWWQANG